MDQGRAAVLRAGESHLHPLRPHNLTFLQDLWSHTDNGTAVRNVSVPGVPAHGVVALLLRDAGDEPAGTEPLCAVPDWCIDKNGTFV